MNHTLILRRAFELVRRYPVLWILGILLAIAAGVSSSGSNPTITLGDMSPGRFPGIGPAEAGVIATVVIALICLVLLLAIVLIVVRYVVRAGLYRSVEQIEDSEQVPTFRQAWRLGWNWRAFRLFLIDLVIFIPLTIVVVALVLLPLVPLFLLVVDNTGVRVFSVLLTVGVGLFVLLVLIVAAAVISLFLEFIYRAAVLDNRDVFDAIKLGLRMVRDHFTDVGIMWLLMFGIGLVYGLLLIPLFLLLGALALALGGGLGWLLYELFGSPLVSMLAGGPLALAIFAIPLVIIGGFYEAFKSSVWTLTYREVHALRGKP